MNNLIPKLKPTVQLPTITGKRPAEIRPIIDNAVPWAGMGLFTYSTKTFDTNSEDTLPYMIALSDDGDKMFIGGRTSKTVFEYDLGTTWDCDTAVYNGVNFVLPVNQPQDMTFSTDGLRLFVVFDAGDVVHEYPLSIPWDLSTANSTPASTFVVAEDTDVEGLAFSYDGTRMFLCGLTTSAFYQYDLGTPFNVGSAVYNGVSFALTGFREGIFIGPNGTDLYLVRGSGNSVTRFTLETPWDLSTAVEEANELAVVSEDIRATSIALGDLGRKMYLVGDNGGDTVDQYEI